LKKKSTNNAENESKMPFLLQIVTWIKFLDEESMKVLPQLMYRFGAYTKE